MEIIGEILVKIFGAIFAETIVGSFIDWLFYVPYLVGVFLLKMLTFDSRPVKELKYEYKDSSKPWFLGFGAGLATFYFIFSYLV